MLLNGNTVSCGCKKKEHNLKHGYGRRGKRRSKTYIAWDAMIQRCTNSAHPNYKNYGARGVKVCRHWLTFENFLADMGEAPEGLELERAKNDQGYKPSNCSWQTRKHQTRNTRLTVRVNYKGKRLPLRELAEDLGLPFTRLYYRLRAGWSVVDAVTKPPYSRP